MALLDFLNPSDEEIKKRTNIALAKQGNPEATQAVLAQDDADAAAKLQDHNNALSLSAPQIGITPVQTPITGPSPASQPTAPEVNTSTPPPGRWAAAAGIQTPASNPYADSFKAANQVASMMPSTGTNMQMSASKERGDAQAQGFLDQEKALGEQGKALDESQERIKGIQAEKEVAQKKFDAEYEEATKDLKDTKIDSERLWKNKSTGNKILTGIGLALSAFGGPEAVARTNQIIQSAVDKDIEEQKANYGIKKEGVQNMNTVFARMMDRYGDKEKAELATRAYYNEKLSNQVAQIGARSGSATVKANEKAYQGQLQSQKDGIVGQLGLTLAQSAASKTPKFGDPIVDNYDPKNEDERKRYVPGVGLATDPEAAKSLRDSAATFANFNGGVSKLIDMREKYGSETMPTEAKGVMKQIYAELLLDKKSMAKLGVMSESDLEMLQSIVADPTSFNPATLARLKALKADGIGKFQRGINPYLMNPVQSLGMKLKSGQF